jgi:hypothetical protein
VLEAIIMLTKESASRLSKCLVACNIYVSAGQARWAPFLFQLLEEAQQECTRLRRGSSSSSLAVVHAYADGPYDRSSFHVAGSSTLVASLASHIAASAATTLSSLRQQEEETKKLQASSDESSSVITTHPTVGLVDHVTVLPLPQKQQSDEESSLSCSPTTFALDEWVRTLEMDCPPTTPTSEIEKSNHSSINPSKNATPTLPSGWVARSVGRALEQAGVQVFWYGHADPHQTPLAQVRKEKTNFFQSLPSGPTIMGQATVGAPSEFVENYNIQVATHDKRKAQSLTKWVRGRDGGLPFVEALTLPYGTTSIDKDGKKDIEQAIPVFEVACNLLNPAVTSTNDIDARVQTWVDNNNNNNRDDGGASNSCSSATVLSSYRVGTTKDMCLKALHETSTSKGEEEYNRRIRDALVGYLKDSR